MTVGLMMRSTAANQNNKIKVFQLMETPDRRNNQIEVLQLLELLETRDRHNNRMKVLQLMETQKKPHQNRIRHNGMT